MEAYHQEAKGLNQIIENAKPAIYRLLSDRGKAIYYPKKGMLKQGAEARGKSLNATIGMALEEDGSPMRHGKIERTVSLEPKCVFPYAPSFGLPKLRETWKNLLKKKNPSLEEPFSCPVVTGGLSHGLSVAGYLFVNPGDRIISTDPFWENYNLIFRHAYGARFLKFPAFTGDAFSVGALSSLLKQHTGKQIVLLNFPQNPTGYTLINDEAEAIVETFEKSAREGNTILVILDDAYFGLVYHENVLAESLFAPLSHLHENIITVKIDGATKEDYAWGLRVGFITFASKALGEDAYGALEDKAAGVIRGSVSSSSHISQSLILEALSSADYDAEKKKKFQLLKSRYEAVDAVLSENKEKYAEVFRPLPHNSGYFMCIKLKEGLDAERIRLDLLEKYDTGVIAIGDMIRIAFSSVKLDDIPRLFDNIYMACRADGARISGA